MLAEATPPDERVWSYTSAGHWEVAEEPLHRFWESFTPVHVNMMREGCPDSRGVPAEEMARRELAARAHGAGLGIAFGAAMADLTGRPVGLLPCAHGGTSMSQWSQDLAHLGGASLYGGILERARRAGGTVRGLLWYQGESDCSALDAPRYQGRLDAWIAAVRRDLAMPELPVIVVQIGRFAVRADDETARAWDLVREVLLRVPDRVPNTAVVGAIDLSQADAIHISAAGHRRLGKRLARAAAALTGVPGGGLAPRVIAAERGAQGNGLTTITVRCDGVTRGWRDEQPLAGFEVTPAEGETAIVGVEPVGKGGSDIRLVLEPPVAGPMTIAYGLGMAPVCTVVDRADMPLCAFRPMPVTDPVG